VAQSHSWKHHEIESNCDWKGYIPSLIYARLKPFKHNICSIFLSTLALATACREEGRVNGIFRCVRDDGASNCRFDIFNPMFRVARVAIGIDNTHTETRLSLSCGRGRIRSLAIPRWAKIQSTQNPTKIFVIVERIFVYVRHSGYFDCGGGGGMSGVPNTMRSAKCSVMNSQVYLRCIRVTISATGQFKSMVRKLNIYQTQNILFQTLNLPTSRSITEGMNGFIPALKPNKIRVITLNH
jgi:hypothetical protein